MSLPSLCNSSDACVLDDGHKGPCSRTRPRVREMRGQWFALPNGPGSDVGPFSSEADARDWLRAPSPDSEKNVEEARET